MSRHSRLQWLTASQLYSVKSPDRLVMGPVLAFALSIVIYSAITAVFITAMVYFTAQTSENIESVVVSSTELEAQGFTCDSLSETTLAGPPIAEPEWPAFNFNSQCGLLLGTFVGHPSELTQFHKVYFKSIADCTATVNDRSKWTSSIVELGSGVLNTSLVRTIFPLGLPVNTSLTVSFTQWRMDQDSDSYIALRPVNVSATCSDRAAALESLLAWYVSRLCDLAVTPPYRCTKTTASSRFSVIDSASLAVGATQFVLLALVAFILGCNFLYKKLCRHEKITGRGQEIHPRPPSSPRPRTTEAGSSIAVYPDIFDQNGQRERKLILSENVELV